MTYATTLDGYISLWQVVYFYHSASFGSHGMYNIFLRLFNIY